MTPGIPIDPTGYRVSDDGVIHTRYATHGEGQRTRTAVGVITILAGRHGKPCSICFPHPRYPKTPLTTPQKRRSSPDAAPLS